VKALMQLLPPVAEARFGFEPQQRCLDLCCQAGQLHQGLRYPNSSFTQS
jgi:hypothetical protein